MDENEPIVYIKKEEFIERLTALNIDLFKIGLQYARQILAERNKEIKVWLNKQMEELSADISSNAFLIRRAEIESGYNIFWISQSGNLVFRRCSRREYKEIYEKPSTLKHYA